MTTTPDYTPVQNPYITRNPAICGGKPVIAGTRVRVAQVALEYDVLGWTPDQIVEAHPHLGLAQVHAALAYYYENLPEIQTDLRLGEEFVDALRTRS